mmetsp:Transcript_33217/g.23947  ORF Transcript_33217/g.23947 Transcript_33217/m.23947 type:complete len:92 (-) Transcript_33217:1668-1943(-)
MLISGASRIAYWLSNYTIDVVFISVPAVIGVFFVRRFEIDVPDCEQLFLYFVLVNPVFIYCLSFMFDSDTKGSVLVRVFYFVFGGIAPLAI